MTSQHGPFALPRRRFLALTAGAGLGLVAGCADSPPTPGAQGTGTPSPSRAPSASGLLLPGSAAGTLAAAPVEIDLAGTVVTTWAYNGVVPGPEIRLRRGEVLRARLTNALAEETTIHWHGITVPSAMDGVPYVSQAPVQFGEEFAYEFAVPDAGSHMYHAHVGHQLDRGLYGPLIVESDEDEPMAYDREYTLMIDDWRDGLGVTEAGVHGGGHSATPTGEPSGGGPRIRFGLGETTPSTGPSGAPADDTEPDAPTDAGANPGERLGGRVYPMYLINGRPAADPPTLEVRSGERVRLRLMNIAADTGFLVAIAGHSMTITHTDGAPVQPVTVDAVRLGMGERYDVVVSATNPGVWQLAAMPEAKRGFARAVLRYVEAPASTPPPLDLRPSELSGRQVGYDELVYAGSRDRPSGEPDREHELTLTSTSRINGQRYPDADPLEVAAGELVRIRLTNTATIGHPMHLHGHPFWVATPGGNGPLKDTALVDPNGGVASFDFVADNAGTWMFHCHNHYHMENGMARLFDYA
ncbi:MAG: multicopper oxidase family protein [Sporichthyaceae bacterium]